MAGRRESQESLVRLYRLLVGAGNVVELRALDVRGKPNGPTHTEAGFFDHDHLAELADHAARLTRTAAGVYYTLNPLNPDLMARCCNRADWAKQGSSATDAHVLRRRWLLLDADPVRVSGISAAEEEKALARDAAVGVRAWLADQGWPAPIFADSGNGYHLLYRIELPADDGGVVERVLLALAERFDTDKVKIDRKVFNPSRINKLYGTWARKGENLADRPHRLARVLDVAGLDPSADQLPDDLQVVPVELLNDLAGEKQQHQKKEQKTAGAAAGGNNGDGHYAARLMVDRWLSDRDVAFRVKDKPDGKGRTVYVLKDCPFDSSHGDPDSCIMQESGGKLSAQCFHNSCSGRGWQEFKEAIGKPDGHHYDPPMEGRKREGRATPATPATPASRKPRAPSPWKPFPLGALPGVVRDHVTAAAACIGCDPALVALPELAALAAAIGNSRAVVLKRGWSEPPCIWAVTVAESGAQKTPAFDVAVGPLQQIQCELEEAHRDALEHHRKAGGDRDDAPPNPPRFVTTDATIEAMAEMQRHHPRGGFAACDELDTWFQGLTNYKGKNGGSDRAKWLQMHSAKVLIVDRKTQPEDRLVVRRALASVCGTIQPGVLAKALSKDALAAGLGARFLFAMPPRRARVWSEDEIEDDLAKRYDALLRSLLGLQLKDARKREPHFLGLSRDAKALWVDYFNTWGRIQLDAEDAERAAFSKIEGYAARLMLIHHVVCHVGVEDGHERAVTAESAGAGIEMAKWFAREAVRIYSMLAETDEGRELRRLVEFVQRRDGRASVRDLQKSNARKYPRSEDAEADLQRLVEAGLARWLDPASAPRGGNVSRVVELLRQTSDTSDTWPGGEGETPGEEDQVSEVSDVWRGRPASESYGLCPRCGRPKNSPFAYLCGPCSGAATPTPVAEVAEAAEAPEGGDTSFDFGANV